jgi:hypothetical protein
MRFAELNKSNIVADINFGDTLPTSGDWVETSDGQICSLGMKRLENGEFIPVPNLEDAIVQVQQTIADHAQFLLSESVSGYSNEERDTWFGKQDESLKYLKTKDLKDAPNLAIEATAAGLPIEILATIVTRKANALRAYTSHVLGVRARHSRAIAAMSDLDELLAYNWADGWETPAK